VTPRLGPSAPAWLTHLSPPVWRRAVDHVQFTWGSLPISAPGWLTAPIRDVFNPV